MPTTTQEGVSSIDTLPDHSEPLAVQQASYDATRRRITELRDQLYLRLDPEALALVEELTYLHDDAEILYGRTCSKWGLQSSQPLSGEARQTTFSTTAS